MTNRVLRWIAILALGGVAAAATSTYVHLQLVRDPGYTSFCDINASVSCTQVYLSRFGNLGGVPVALGGVLWFVGTLLLAFAGARPPEEAKPNVSGYLLVWSTIGLAVAMYMAYASFIVLKTFCVLCGAVYVTVIGIFILSGTGPAIPMARLPAAVVSDLGRLVRRPIGLGLTAAFVAGAAVSIVWFARQGASTPTLAAAVAAGPVQTATADQQSEFDRFWEAQPRIDFQVPPADDAANADAVLVVVAKFNDYQCPACANTHRAYGPIFAKYASSHPGAVRVVTLDYPLDPECNDQSPNGPHGGACEAAVAVRLARRVGEAERMEEWMYANQETMSRETIVAAARDIAGIEARDFDAQYDAAIEEVKRDIALGATLPVEATPTFVVNGVAVKGGLTPQYFDAAIAYELERAGGSF